MIDPHVHLRDWKQSNKETILHGLTVAKNAGFTSLFDMPNTDPALTSRDMILNRLSDGLEAAKTVKGITYRVYGGLTKDKEQIREVVSAYNELFPLIVGLKLFAGNSTGNMGIVSIEDQKSVLATLTELGYEGVLVVHAEKESLLHPELYVKGKAETHSLARPKEAEIESVRDILSLSRLVGFKGNIHIAHVSTKGAAELIKEAKERGERVTMGVTPHHALYTSEDALVKERYLKMNPPLRDKEDRDAVFSSLLDGSADWAESDHAPHTLEDKENGASGIPGFLGMLLLIEKLRAEGCTEEHLKELFGLNVIKTFKLEEEEIIVPKKTRKKIYQIADEYPFNPYSGL